MKRVISSAILTALFPVTTIAYETDTHSFITSHAFDRSQVKNPDLIRSYGIGRFDDLPESPVFGVPPFVPYEGERNAYFDLGGNGWDGTFSDQFRRATVDYDKNNMISLPGENYREEGRDRHTMKGWLMRGAVREDDLPPSQYKVPPVPDADPHGELYRVFHHFFDPVNNEALLDPVQCLFLPTVSECLRSTDWAFAREDVAGAGIAPVIQHRRNHFAWPDAREAMWCALTRNLGNPHPINLAAQNAAERRLCWATTFKSLGQVLHLLQDAAQPQHVRNDPHNHSDGFIASFFNTSTERRAYEAWTNFRVLDGKEITGNKRGDEEFRTFFGDKVKKHAPVATGPGYPAPHFSEPHHYFTTRQIETAITPASLRKRRGLADFANRSVFSEGTILSLDYPLPPPDDSSDDYVIKERFVTNPSTFGTGIERHVSTALVDPLKGGYPDEALTPFGGLVPLASVTLWADFDTGSMLPDAGAISLDEYSAHADVLIPRAIAYSAGLIDYFFRGKLEITPPLDGLFSVIDHGTPHTVNAKGYPIRSDDSKVFGFTKVRLRVRNATDVVNESGTNLPIPRDVMSTGADADPFFGDPTLVAVARYHRNPCYKPDLSGERRITFDGVVTEPACGPAGTRTPFQEVSVSKPVVSHAAAMNGDGQDLVFDFASQPIPANATDLAIQVVYRGPLGLESDAIAVGSFDVREPTYLTHWNNTDYAACNGTWAAHGATPPGCITQGFGAKRAIFTTRLCIGTQMVFEHLQNAHGTLGTGNYVRLAALLDDKQKATRSRSILDGYENAEIRDRSIAGHLRQSDKEQATATAPFVSEPFFSKRGFTGSLRPVPYYQKTGADPQPANDSGALDVGALAGALPAFPAPDPGAIVFPDVALSNMACTTANPKALFADEIAHAAAVKASLLR